jgi:hypothetical protein
MTVSGSIYFLGRYRPAYFEGESIAHIAGQMITAIRFLQDSVLRDWIENRIVEGHKQIKKQNLYTSWSCDHCDRGVSFAARPHDPWLDSVTAKLPPCPGLDYSVALATIGQFDPVRTLAALVAGEAE